MILEFNNLDLSQYHSETQKIRILTEDWFISNMFCPRCGNNQLEKSTNNSPVCDFICPNCKNQYELKSKNGPLSNKVQGSAYQSMIDRINCDTNPDFLFLNYSKEKHCIIDLIFISKYFFTLDIVEKRRPLSQNARRAGWVGCNILLGKIPPQAKIEIIKNGHIANKENILNAINQINQISANNLQTRGWIIDILNCINTLKDDTFSLTDMYKYEPYLSNKHPSNKNIKEKIRQQLQLLRDKGFIKFLGNGKYQKIKHLQ